MFNISSFFNVRNVKNYINSNNNNKLENKYISDYHCSLYKIQYIVNILIGIIIFKKQKKNVKGESWKKKKKKSRSGVGTRAASRVGLP